VRAEVFDGSDFIRCAQGNGSILRIGSWRSARAQSSMVRHGAARSTPHQRSRAPREITVEQLAGSDDDLGLVFAVLGVEVRRWVVVEVHRDDPVESRDPWHTVDGTRRGATVPASLDVERTVVGSDMATSRSNCRRMRASRLGSARLG